ncbi:long-chain-fatty-acid-CoA ligase [Rickenella mellea]|uniref:Long-chain-fatty-acid-CoA ligase n=1 Tax=Rickenella mellea TaxID=50990 RepID=A0A4Y7PMM5_9AGAM|nr:long-chain-fatty-acid-CoA ligase [Rickenella mellea]
MADAKWTPKLSIAEVDAILTASGMPLETELAIVNGRVLKVYKNQPQNIRKFWLASVMQHKDQPYLVFEGEQYTYHQIHEKACRFASLLYTEYGVRKGDRVAIAMRNYPEYIIAFWAIHLIVPLFTLVNAWAPEEPLHYCLELTEPKVLLVDGERAALIFKPGGVFDKLKSKGKKLTLRNVLVVRARDGSFSKKDRSVQSFDDVLSAYKGPSDKWSTEPEPLPDEDSVIMFTSGTTGRPKGVLSSQRAFIQNTFNVIASVFRSYLRKGESLPPLNDPSIPKKVCLLSVPLFHVAGNTTTLVSVPFLSSHVPHTLLGSKIIILRRWDPNEAARLIKDEKITSGTGVPTMVSDLIETGINSEVMETMSFGGSLAPTSFASEIVKRFPNTIPGQGYGLTETNGVVASITDFLAKPGSTGWAVPDVEILIVDPSTEKIMPPHQVGEVWIKGPNIMTCYWNDPEATDKAITKDGWFKSGDLGYLDEEGFLYIRDRLKDIMIRGKFIHSVEVEDAILKDGRLREAAAVSVPDKRLGELVAARVTTKPEFHGKVTEKEIIESAKRFLPAHAVPVMVLVRNDLMERNEPGKIVKDFVRKEVREGWAKRVIYQRKSSPKSLAKL